MIKVDFNAQTEDGYVRFIRGSLRDPEDLNTWRWIYAGKVRVMAYIEEDLARPDWQVMQRRSGKRWIDQESMFAWCRKQAAFAQGLPHAYPPHQRTVAYWLERLRYGRIRGRHAP